MPAPKTEEQGSNTGSNKVVRKQVVFDYLNTDGEHRLPLAKFLKKHKMIRRTFHTYEGEWKSEVKSKTKVEKENHLEDLRNTMSDAYDRLEGKEPPKRIDGVDITAISEEEKLALARKVYADAMSLGAGKGEKELAVKMLGMLIERQEVTHTVLSAEDISRIDREAERQLKEFNTRTRSIGNRKEEVPKGCSLLPDKIRED